MTGWDGTVEDIVIHSTVKGTDGKDYKVTSIETSAFKGQPIKKLTIGEGVQIGNNAFQNCTELTSVTIENGIEYLSDGCFKGCTGLTLIKLPSTLKEIGKESLAFCTSLKSIDLNNGLTSIYSSAFKNCRSLEKIEIPDSVKTIGDQAFKGCTSMVDASLGNGLEYLGYQTFMSCAFKQIFIPASLKTIDFKTTSSLYLPRLIFPPNLESIEVSENNSTYASIDGVLYDKDCKTLIYCPPAKTGDLRTSAITIMNYAFYASQLDSVTILNGAEEIGNFAFSSGNTGSSAEGYNGAVYQYTNGGQSTIKEIILADSIKTIGNSVFSYSTIKALKLPANLESMGPSAFSSCKNLESIELPDGLKTIQNFTFSECISLKTVKLPASLESLSNIGRIFESCESIESITISDQSTTYCSIDGILFSKDCKTLIMFPSGKTGSYSIPESVDSLGPYAFYKSHLESLNLSGMSVGDYALFMSFIENVITDPNTTFGQYALGFSKISEISIYSKTVEESLCRNCENLTTVHLYNTETISDRAFQGCDALKTIDIPDSLKSIGKYAFSGCLNLSIALPSTLEKVEGSSLPKLKDADGKTPITCNVANIAGCAFVGTGDSAIGLIKGVTAKCTIGESTYLYGVSSGSTFTLPDVEVYGYCLKGWYTDKDFQNAYDPETILTKDIQIFAKLEMIEYTITFVAGGEVVKEVKFTVETTSIDEPNVPDKTGYTGVWETYTLTAENIRVNAIYEIIKLTVEWKDYDGTILKTETVEYGNVPKYPGDDPTRATEGQWEYKFAAWSPALTEITSDMTYSATYSIKQIIPKADGNGTITMEAEKDGLSLSKENIDSLKESVESNDKTELKVTVDGSTVVFDSKAIASIGSVATLVVKKATALDPETSALVEGMTVYEISFGNNKTFGDGKITVTVPYTLKDGETPEDLKVYYIADGKVQETFDATYADGTVTFSTGHLSSYAIGHIDEPSEGWNSDSIIVVALAIAAVVAAIALAVYVSRKNKV